MAINFPSAPTNGQIFDSGITRYTYSTTTGAWSANRIPTLLVAPSFNYIVNGSFQASQQNGDVPNTVAGYYVADQWFASGSAALMTNSESSRATTSTPPNGSNYVIYQQVGAATATLAAADYQAFFSYLEGNRVAAFRYGTAQARQTILRFWIRSTVAGTFGGSIRNATPDRSYVFSFTIAAGQVNTYVKQEFIIPGDITGTWPKDFTRSMCVAITFACGTTYRSATLNAWQAGNFIAPSTITNFAATVMNTATIADVGLYLDVGSVDKAPPWEIMDAGTAEIECQRYWQRSAHGIGVCLSTSTAGRIGGLLQTVPMRTDWTAAFATMDGFSDGDFTNSMSAASATYTNDFYLEFNATGQSTMSTAGATAAYGYQGSSPGNTFVSARM